MNPVRDLREQSRLTQSRLAGLAHTSQPAIASYEAGRKSPSLRTLRRLASAAGFEAIVEFVPRLTREDRRSLALHREIANRLIADPGPTLSRARRTLTLMSRLHPAARPLLDRWRDLLERPIAEIVEVLLDPRPLARELRHLTPFAGLLTPDERARVYRRFASEEARET